MDELTYSIQENAPWCMLFANNVVLIDTTREGVEDKLSLWTNTFEAQKLKISLTKTEYINCNFGGAARREDPFIHLENHELLPKRHFKYLSSVIYANRDIDVDIKFKIVVE